MIENFCVITADDISLKLNLGIRVDVFEGNDEKDIHSYLMSKVKGISWINDSKKIKVLEKGIQIDGFPTHDLKRVIVIYPLEHYKYPSPNNAVVYDTDGTFLHQLTPPKLISDLAKKHYVTGNQGPGTINLLFDNVSWEYDSTGKIVTCIQIGFGRDYIEYRVFDPDTLEFGECLGSSMR